MLSTALKLLALYLINHRFSVAKHRLSNIKEEVADYTESRVEIVKANFQADVQRIVNSFMGFLVALALFVFAGILGLMWLFAVAWSSPNRELLLGAAILIPLLIGLITLARIMLLWRSKPLMAESTRLIANDWRSFRYGLDGSAEATAEASQPS